MKAARQGTTPSSSTTSVAVATAGTGSSSSSPALVDAAQAFLTADRARTLTDDGLPSPTVHVDELRPLLIDARTPTEFHEDHAPGSINLPTLSDEEHAKTGLLYRTNPLAARRMGAAYACRNIANHLESAPLAGLASSSFPKTVVVCCLRGGQRSRALATVLGAIGVAGIAVVDGGYRAYRAQVCTLLGQVDPRLEFTVLHGLTGSGKTARLRELERQGAQTLDLERLARHRGSVFGHLPGEPLQPRQRMFESRLALALLRLSPDRGPVFVEGESQRLGRVSIPPALFERAILCADRVERVEATLDQRVDNILAEYSAWFSAPAEELEARLADVEKTSGSKALGAELRSLWGQDKRREFVSMLLTRHYDVKYKASRVSKVLSTSKSSH